MTPNYNTNHRLVEVKVPPIISLHRTSVIYLMPYDPIKLWSTPTDLIRHYMWSNTTLHTEVYPLPHVIQTVQYEVYYWTWASGKIIYYHPLRTPYKGYTMWSTESI